MTKDHWRSRDYKETWIQNFVVKRAKREIDGVGPFFTSNRKYISTTRI